MKEREEGRRKENLDVDTEPETKRDCLALGST